MVTKAVMSVMLILFLVSSVAATQGLATAPVNKGNALTDTANIISSWQQNGKTTTSLTLSSATESNILNYWQNDGSLLVYNNIGDANTDNYNGAPCYGLTVSGGEITSSEISNLNPSTGIAATQIFINSCNSFENPLHDAFLSKDVFMYTGGVVLLPGYSSEDTAASYWYNNQVLSQSHLTSLANAESAHGTTGMYGTYCVGGC